MTFLHSLNSGESSKSLIFMPNVFRIFCMYLIVHYRKIKPFLGTKCSSCHNSYLNSFFSRDSAFSNTLSICFLQIVSPHCNVTRSFDNLLHRQQSKRLFTWSTLNILGYFKLVKVSFSMINGYNNLLIIV